jgi:hypothetical protein
VLHTQGPLSACARGGLYAEPGKLDSLSPLRWIPLAELLLSPKEILAPKHLHVNPPSPTFRVPCAEWSRIVQRVAQGESLRQVARSYRVSYEAIRRILAAAQRSLVQEQAVCWLGYSQRNRGGLCPAHVSCGNPPQGLNPLPRLCT